MIVPLDGVVYSLCLAQSRGVAEDVEYLVVLNTETDCPGPNAPGQKICADDALARSLSHTASAVPFKPNTMAASNQRPMHLSAGEADRAEQAVPAAGDSNASSLSALSSHNESGEVPMAEVAVGLLDSLSHLSQAVPVSFAVSDDGSAKLLYCGHSIQQMTGLAQADLYANPALLRDLLSAGDVPATVLSLKQAAIQRAAWQREVQWQHPGDGTVWLEACGRVELAADGAIVWNGLLLDISERRRLDAERELQRRKLQTILDTVPAGIYVKDSQHRYRRVNGMMCRVLNLSASEFLGRTDAELGFTGSDKYEQEDNQVIRTGQSLRGIVDEVNTAGGVRWLQIDKQPYFDDSGQIAGVLGMAVDVTERIQAEVALRAGEARLREAQSIGRIGSFYWDAATDHTEWSENMYRMFRVSPATFGGTFASYLALVHEADRGAVQSQLQAAFHSSDEFAHDYRVKTENGDVLWMRARGRILRDSAMQVTSVVGTCQDITEQKQADEVLQGSEQLHRQLLNAIPDSVLIVAKGVIQFCNAATQQLTGARDISDLPGMPVDSILLPGRSTTDHHVAKDRLRWKLPESLVDSHSELQLYRFHDDPIPVEAFSTPLTYRGEPAILIALHDLSRRRRMEEELRAAQKMEAVGRLAGGVAHDFNNLLTVILGYTELLLSGLSPDAPEFRLIEEVNKAGNRASGLTRQLLTYSRRQEVAPSVIDLNWVILNSLQMLNRILGENVAVSIDVYPKPLPIMIDPVQMEQVLMNLAANARDAMPDGGQLVISTDLMSEDGRPDAESRQWVQLIVLDTGSGIPGSIVDRVVDPFFTTKQPGHGIGLGLSVVHGIVEQARGRLEIVSNAGHSTEVQICFPVATSLTDQPGKVTGGQQVRGGRETILIIEDEAAVRDIAVMSLTMCGYKVLAAANGNVALGMLQNQDLHVDLLISDVVLPDMNAGQLAARFQQRFPQSQLLFMSGYAEDSVLRHGIDLRENVFIQKPFSPDVFCKTVRAVMDNKHKE